MLTDTACKKAKPTGKRMRLYDTAGMYLEIAPAGGRWWRLKYRFAGKEKALALGVYPEVTLAEARTKRDEARKLLHDGIDPSAHRKVLKASRATSATNTLKNIAEEWLARFEGTWAPSHTRGVKGRLGKDVYPWIGSRPIAEITPPEVLAVLRRIEGRGRLETAHRVRTHLGMIFRFAIATGRAERDPTADLRGALPASKAKHMAAVTEPAKLAELLRVIWGYQEGTPVVAAALKLAPMLFVRPGELRAARWADIDLAKAEWRFTASKTKAPHIVPLAKQAVAILRDLRPLTGLCTYVFPSQRSRDRPMSDAAVNAALRRLDIASSTASGHGFRATARTLLDEVLGFRVDLIEAQLAHAVRDPLGRAYNRTAFLPERKAMMQRWADYLGVLAAGDFTLPVVQPMPGAGTK
jgi:integrase